MGRFIYVVKDFFETLYYKLNLTQFKYLCSFIKMWWNYVGIDAHDSLNFMYFDIGNIIEVYEVYPDTFVGQDKTLKDMKIFRECLRRYIEDDHSCWDSKNMQFVDYRSGKFGFKLYRIKVKENEEMLFRYIKKIGRWNY